MADRRLDSWKAIAAHFDVSVRTVQRWAKSESLPVHQLVHQKAGPVYAYEHELDAWRAERSQPLSREPREPEDLPPEDLPPATADIPANAPPEAPKTHLWKLVGFALALAIVVGGFVALPARNSPPPAKFPGRLLINDTSEGAKLLTIRVGRQPHSAVISPDGCCLYVSNVRDNTVSVIDTATNGVAAPIPVGKSPTVLAIAPDGRHLYVCSRDSGAISVVNTRDRSVETIRIGDALMDMVLAPDGKSLYVTEQSSGLWRVRIADRKPEHLDWITKPEFLALDQDGSHLYINYQSSGPAGAEGHDAMEVRELATGRPVGNPTGFPSVGGPMTMSPLGNYLWASGLNACSSPEYNHQGCPTVPAGVFNVISTLNNWRVRTVPVRDTISEYASFFPDGSRVTLDGDSLNIVDASSFHVVERLDRRGHGRVVFTPDGHRAYYPLDREDEVAVFNLSKQACMPAPTGLVGWWSGDGTPNDIRWPNDGQPVGNLRYAQGRVGQAFLLDGKSASLDLGHLSSIGGTREFTVAAWVRFEDPPGREEPILDRVGVREKSPDGWRLSRQSDGRILFWVAPCTHDCGAEARSKTVVSAGSWVHVAASKSLRELALYVNGRREAIVTSDADAWLDTGVATIVVGSSKVPKSFMKGMVDEIMWLNRPAAPAEIEGIFRAGGAGVCYSAQ